MLNAIKLCLLTKTTAEPFSTDYLQFIQQAISGGVTSIQLRAKGIPNDLLKTQAYSLKEILDPLGIPLILNDNVPVAKEIHAAGVHLGQRDTPPDIARQLLGPDKLIGLSIETLPQLRAANKLDCINYVACSAVFPTQSKPDCNTIWGLDGLIQFCDMSRHPVVAIGGINVNNISAVHEAGVAGVAVIGAIHDADNPALTASQFIPMEYSYV